MSNETLTLLLAGLTVLLAIIAIVVARETLSYMRGRDLEVDTRNGWIEIHKAMINLRVERALIILPGQMGAYMPGASIPLEERVKGYTFASAQLRGQLDRLNDEPLVEEISEFLNDNILTEQWQKPEFQTAFDAFAQRVAMKSRPTAGVGAQMIQWSNSMFRRLAREAVIFMLLGMVLTAVGSFVYMHHVEAVSIRTQRETIKKGCLDADVGGIDVYGGTGIDLSGGFVPKSKPPQPPQMGQYTEKDIDPSNDWKDVDPPKGDVFDQISPSPNGYTILPTKEECLRAKNLKIDNEADAFAAAVFGLYGFAGGFGVWLFYRLVRFAVTG